MKRPSLGRLVALLVVFAVAIGGIVVRLAILQVSDASHLRTLGVDQRTRAVQLAAARGRILDRTGEPLAMSMSARDVYADPRYVVDPDRTAAAIAPILGMKEGQVRAALTAQGSFTYIDRQVDTSVAARLQALGLPGIGFIPVSKRYYPAGALAPQLLGFVGVDGTGLAGLELQYQQLLAGRAGQRIEEIDPNGRTIVGGIDINDAPVPGSDVVTTIDRPLQYLAQQALERAVRANKARGGTVIVMNPHSGDLYAIASFPWFDPNHFDTASAARQADPAIVDAFEPGSVNKVITAAAAVQEKVLSIHRRLLVPDQIQVGPSTIHDAHVHSPEQMTLGDIVAQSSNVGITKVADLLGQDRMASYLAKFGLGQPTGVGFPGESSGQLLPLYDWSATSLATFAYGQGISATPLQMAAVYATLANAGVWVRPRLVRGTVDASGHYVPASSSSSRQVISSRTADTVTQMLAYAVQQGTGQAAQVKGYQVAGKTGTAQIPKANGTGYLNTYNASFMGFLPARSPQVVIVAILDQPATVYGGIAAAPLFREVARDAIQRLQIAPDRPVPLPPRALAHP